MSSVSSEGGQDFDLNLAPIIDCFTVLITYLLVSASFISLTALEVGVAAVGQADGGAPKVPPYNFMVELSAAKVLTLKLTGGPKNLDLKIPLGGKAGGTWDTQGLERQISQFKASYPELKEVTLTAEASVVYKDVVLIVEELKKQIEKVFLSG